LALIYSELLSKFFLGTPKRLPTYFAHLFPCQFTVWRKALLGSFDHRQMFPGFPFYDAGNTALAYAKLMSNFPCSLRAGCNLFSHFANLLIRELRFPLFFSNGKASLLGSIFKVFFMGSKEHVVRIYASRIISTGAVVANEDSIRNWTLNEQPCGPMGAHAMTVNLCHSVSVSTLGCCPKPAGISLLDVGKKTVQRSLKLPSPIAAFFAAKVYRSYARGFALENFIANSTLNLHLKTFLLGVWRASGYSRWLSANHTFLWDY